jgi:8-oxo-dGTP pyrophosphatase MutT (NUDIX family)
VADLHADAVRTVGEVAPTTADQAAVRTRFLDLLATQPGACRPDNPGAHLTASALVVDAALDRVLLCLHGRMGRWVQLGGHCEPHDATVADAALREATEESGIEGLRIHPVPIDLDIHPVTCRYGPSLHYDVRFAVLAPPDASPQVSEESADLAWFAPNALPSPLAHATERLVVPALAAAHTMVTSR